MERGLFQSRFLYPLPTPLILPPSRAWKRSPCRTPLLPLPVCCVNEAQRRNANTVLCTVPRARLSAIHGVDIHDWVLLPRIFFAAYHFFSNRFCCECGDRLKKVGIAHDRPILSNRRRPHTLPSGCLCNTYIAYAYASIQACCWHLRKTTQWPPR